MSYLALFQGREKNGYFKDYIFPELLRLLINMKLLQKDFK